MNNSMSKAKYTKEEALKKLAQLDEKTLSRLAEISDNSKARSYFSNDIQFALLKGYLAIKK